MRLKPADWYGAHDVELLTGAQVTGLDPAARTVQVDDAALGFDDLVLATGGRPRPLPEAAGLPGVLAAAA